MKMLPILYIEGYKHAREDAAAAIMHRIKALERNARYARVAEQRATKVIVEILRREYDYINKMVTTPDERAERNLQDGAD